MFNLFKSKSKEEKEQDLQAELIALRVKYADEIKSYCKIGSHIFILTGFSIVDNEIVVNYKDKDLAKGYVYNAPLYWFRLKYGTNDFKQARYNFILFKQELEKIRLKLEKI